MRNHFKAKKLRVFAEIHCHQCWHKNNKFPQEDLNFDKVVRKVEWNCKRKPNWCMRILQNFSFLCFPNTQQVCAISEIDVWVISKLWAFLQVFIKLQYLTRELEKLSIGFSSTFLEDKKKVFMPFSQWYQENLFAETWNT